jgi:hypothetical protein
MSDTLRMMEVVDSLSQATDLEGACRALVSSPALGRPFHAATIGMVDDRAHLSEMARFNMPGLPQDFWNVRMWVESRLSHLMVSNTPALIHRGLFHAVHPDIRYDWANSPFESMWVLPIAERGVPYGVLLLFSKEILDTVDVEENHRDLLSTSLKLLLRSHEWRHGLQPNHSEQRAS